MKRLFILAAFSSFILGVSSCKKEEETIISPPDWIRGEWVDSVANANGADDKQFINFSEDNITVYTQYGAYSDYKNNYDILLQVSESTGYYLRFSLKTNGGIGESTFRLMPNGSLVSLYPGGNDGDVYVRP